jgi:hypothetical protein
MAEYAGQVFCSTLPSGKLYAFSAGRQAVWGRSLSSRWHHVTATRSGKRLTLFVDGLKVAQSSAHEDSDYDLDTTAPLRLGTGMNGQLNGLLADVRIYQRVLRETEIKYLSKRRPRE